MACLIPMFFMPWYLVALGVSRNPLFHGKAANDPYSHLPANAVFGFVAGRFPDRWEHDNSFDYQSKELR